MLELHRTRRAEPTTYELCLALHIGSAPATSDGIERYARQMRAHRRRRMWLARAIECAFGLYLIWLCWEALGP